MAAGATERTSPSKWLRPRAKGLDALGGVKWDRTFGSAASERFTAVVALPKRVVLVGLGLAKSNYPFEAMAYGGDAQTGTPQWAFRYKEGNSSRAYAAVPRHDGGVVAVGWHDHTASKSSNGWLAFISEQGFQTKSVSIGDTNDENLFAAVRHGKGYAVAGVRYGKGSWVVVTDAAGKVAWQRVVPRTDLVSVNVIVSLKDGGLGVGGSYNYLQGGKIKRGDGFVFKMAADGAVRWRAQLGLSNGAHSSVMVPALAQASDGSLLAVDGSGQPALHRLDAKTGYRMALTTIVAHSPFGGVATDDDGLLLVGSRNLTNRRDSKWIFNGGGNRKAWAVRLDAWGNSGCNTSGTCADKSTKDCDDGKQCTNEACIGSKCSHKAAVSRPCDGKTFCTATWQCNNKAACVKKDDKLFVRSHSFAKGFQFYDYESFHGVAQAPDGAVVAVGSMQHRGGKSCNTCYAGRVVWLDGGGNVLRAASYAPFAGVYFHDVDVRSDGSVAAIGYRKDYLGKNARGVFARFDELGNLLAVRDLYPPAKAPTSWRVLNRMTRYGKDKYLVAGHYISGSNYFTWLQQIDAKTGVQATTPAYPSNSGVYQDVAIANDGRIGAASSKGYVAVYAPGKTNPFLVNLQPVTGRIVSSIVPTYDNAFVVAGWSSKGSFAAKITADNKVSWFREYDAAGDDRIYALSRLPDGRFALAGYAHNAKNGTEQRLLTLAADGTKLSDVLLSGSRNEYFYGLTTLADGTLFAVGQSGLQKPSSGWRYWDVVVSRFSGWGHDQCVKAGFCADVTVQSCIDGNPCTIDSCDPGKGCTNAVVKDGAACGTGKVCKSGKCG